MNEIEKMFNDAYMKLDRESGRMYELLPQQVVGIYKVDFIYGKCAVEIDGHEYHKTKEQREYDYKRERYLIKQGFVPVRFMGTEVFLDAEKCVEEIEEIAGVVDYSDFLSFLKGKEFGDPSGKAE
jgi:very-short-patch-repair endonuclease